MYQVLLFYKYVTISDPDAVAQRIRDLCRAHGLLGRAIVAQEGINVTLEGGTEATEAFVQDFFSDARFADITIKRSQGTGTAFPKLSVKVRDEIVGTRFDTATVDPRIKTAPHVSAGELRTWYETGKDFVVVDMRNDYEYRSGHFKDSINPELESSRDLPAALPRLEPLKEKTVLTVCTGGVRCEKMSAYLLANGFTDVYQLENGIHGYMEQYPGKDFEGTLYTFDNRLTMDFGGQRLVVGTCHLCAAFTEQYVNCGNNLCHLHFLVCAACKGDEATYCSVECKELCTT